MTLLGFNPYLVGGVAAAFLAVASFGGCQYVRAEKAVSDRETAQASRDAAITARDAAIAANVSNVLTIKAQGAALDKWVSLGASPEEIADLVRRAGEKLKEFEKLWASNQKLKEKDRANPECEALRNIDFARVCPNRARVLRGYEGRDRDKIR